MTRATLWEVSLKVAPEAEEAVSELFERIFAAVPSAFTELATGRTKLSVFLEVKPSWSQTRQVLEAGLSQIRAAGLNPGPCRPVLRGLGARNWAESWKHHFKPIEIGRALLIKPSWSQRRARKGQHTLVLDPGLSFGTGHHPTTAFCLRQIVLCRRFGGRQSFLDIGTGSGILALAAAAIGYAPVYAFDLEPEAVRGARANARRNRLASRIHFFRQDVTARPLAPKRKFSLVCANLVADLLIRERALILAQLHPAGTLVLAGILKTEFSDVRRAYAAAGLHLVASRVGREWRSGAFTKRSPGIPGYDVDTPCCPREHPGMQVTLTKDLEKFIARKVQTGGYADPSEVVRDALRNFRAKEDPAEIDSQELAEILLPAVRGRHRPLIAKHFRELRLRARRKPAHT